MLVNANSVCKLRKIGSIMAFDIKSKDETIKILYQKNYDFCSYHKALISDQ
ncbi:MAG: hypothetical protein CM15mP58_08230 [Burkholderiaceae bacterium]|nr:MAG: hypothetical protein CM15mP58_08230 [Burkholderiaceae bacterium]